MYLIRLLQLSLRDLTALGRVVKMSMLISCSSIIVDKYNASIYRKRGMIDDLRPFSEYIEDTVTTRLYYGHTEIIRVDENNDRTIIVDDTKRRIVMKRINDRHYLVIEDGNESHLFDHWFSGSASAVVYPDYVDVDDRYRISRDGDNWKYGLIDNPYRSEYRCRSDDIMIMAIIDELYDEDVDNDRLTYIG